MSTGEVLMTTGQITNLTGIILGTRPSERPASRADALAGLHAAAAAAGIADVDRFLGRPYAVASEELHAAATTARAEVPAKPRRARSAGAATVADAPAAAATGEPTAAPSAERAPTKRQVLLDLVLAPAGATEAELCAAVGWKACMVTLRRAASAAGVTLRGERTKGQPTRWFGTRA